MTHKHLTRELLMAVAEGDAESSELLHRLFEHLAELCPECRRELGVLLENEPLDLDVPLTDVTTIPPAFWTTVEEERNHRDSVLLPTAREEMEILLETPREERRDLILESDDGFRNPVLVQLLLNEYWERVNDDVEDARHLGHLALEIARRISQETYGRWLRQDLVLRSRACIANALRAAGELKRADRDMVRILREVDYAPEPLLQAEIFSFAASLRKDQRRFEEAEDLLDKALELYRQVNDLPKAAGVLVNRANLRYHQGRPREASDVYHQALALIDRDEHPRMFIHIEHNLASCLCDLGEYETAQRRLQDVTELWSQHPDTHFQLRRRWLLGRIALGLGQSHAEDLLLEVRDDFAAQSLGYDAALVNLDLALLYTEQGRPADVRKLAEEMLPIFQAQDIHREALAALLIFRRAAAEETVSVQMVRDLAGYLRQARHDPRLRDELPS